MKKIVKIYLVFLFTFLKLSAYDPSFSELIQEVYAEYHSEKGDWCDQLSDQIAGRSLSFLELQQEGIDPDYLDAMAIEYCKKHSDAYIAIIWPTLDYSYENMIYEILSKECLVAYKKEFVLKKNAPKALIQSIPEKVPHIPKDFHCYFAPEKDQYPMMCFVIRAPQHETTVRTKRVLRDIVKLDPYCMHINDTHDQCLDLAYMLLSNNSIHFLNHREPQNFENFNSLVPLYIQFLQNRNIPLRDVCVDGSSVLSAYGIRDSSLDFDFLCTKFGDFGDIHPLDHHNSAWERLNISIPEVIYNPKNFFYYKGLKFASLMKIRSFKELQGRSNDIKDVSWIDELLSTGIIMK